MAELSLPREDLSGRRGESFQPPPHERAIGVVAGLKAAARRLSDLQFGSIWRDLAVLLPVVRGTLVDVGSGAQPFRDLLHPTVRYVAVDIAEAESQFGYRVPDTRYYRDSVLPVSDGEADFVLCTETLEHVRDTSVFLAEIRRILGDDGQLIMTVPFAARWHYVPHDYWRYTPAGLLHILETAGFSQVRIHARGGALAVAAYKVLGYVFLLLSGHGNRGLAALPFIGAGLCLLPAACTAVLVGNLGLRLPGPTDDTLGYTILAQTRAAQRTGSETGC